MAGLILAILGGVELLLAFVFAVLAVLFANPAALPAWVDIGDVPGDASPRLVLLGVVAAIFALLQVAVGVFAARGAEGAVVRTVMAMLAVAGLLLTVLGSLSTGGLNPIFLPIMALYGYVLVSATLDPILERQARD